MKRSTPGAPPAPHPASDTSSNPPTPPAMSRQPLPGAPATSGANLPSVPTGAVQPPPAGGVSSLQAQLVQLLGAGNPSPNLAALRGLISATSLDTRRPLNAPIPNAVNHAMLPAMQTWSIQQLEQHINLLNQLSQPVPQTVAILLADAKRKEEKRKAKRVANRISASSSRARKKALVQEMTVMNQHLKRQALILALIPDMVVVLDESGYITFCSAQVENVLQHKPDSLERVLMENLLVPSSRGKLRHMMRLLLDDKLVDKKDDSQVAVVSSDNGGSDEKSDKKSASSSPGKASSLDVTSFPPSVVQVDKKSAPPDENDNSDISASNQGSKEPSSLTVSNLTRSPTADSFPSSSEEDKKQKASGKKTENASASDQSNSSLSAEAAKLKKANANLERNVRWHNRKLKVPGFRDDVIGAAITANNRDARLSSLQHRPGSSSEEDSGYRESNDSREETSSSSDSSESKGRPKPLAPTCNICLIKNDLTTVWCEVTSSVRTPENSMEVGLDEDSRVETRSEVEQGKEILLCLRPIRDGEEKMDEKYRLVLGATKAVSASSEQSSGTNSSQASGGKRKRGEEEEDDDTELDTKKPAVDDEVVESLMLMSSEKQRSS